MRHLSIILFFILCLIEAKAQSTLEQIIYNAEEISPNQSMNIKAFSNGDFVLISTNRSMDSGRIYVRRYNAFGQLQWSKFLKLDAQFLAGNINTTSSGDVLIGGYGYIGSGYETVVVKLGKDGNVLWQNYYTPTGYTSNLYSVSENKKGEILIYGAYSKIGGGYSGHYITHLNADGTVIKTKALYESGLWGQAYPAQDGGIFINSGEGIQKYDGDGNLQWMKLHPSGFTRTMYGGVDEYNNFYCVSGSGTTYLMAKFSATGKPIWQKHIGMPFSRFRVANNQLLLINISSKTIYAYDLDGDFTHSVKYNYPYEDAISGISGKYWLTGRLDMEDYTGIVLGRTDNQLLTTCAQTADSFNMISQNYTYEKSNETGSFLTSDIKSISAFSNDYGFNTDTLCFSSKPLPVNLGNDTTLCLGDSLLLDAGNSGSEYLWSTGEKTQKIWVATHGTYKVLVKNAFGETGEDSVTITFETKPEIIWNFNKQEAEPGDILVLQDESSLQYKRLWILPNGDISSQKQVDFPITDNGNYKFTLRLTNTSGCATEISKTVKVAYYRAYFPNAFTPDNDNLNDVFVPKGYGISNYKIKIYNRWGELVYDGNNTGWDGSFKGKVAASGMYFYKAEIFNVQNRGEYFSGNLYLFR